MSRLAKAKVELQKIYEDHGMNMVLEAMDIINKYSSFTSKELINFTIDELQTDAMRLTSLNFYLSSLSANLEADAVNAYNARKYHEANNWGTYKREDPKAKQGELDKKAEESIHKYRNTEAEAQRKSKIMSAAVGSVQEVVNMLKKVVERIMWEGQAGRNL